MNNLTRKMIKNDHHPMKHRSRNQHDTIHRICEHTKANRSVKSAILAALLLTTPLTLVACEQLNRDHHASHNRTAITSEAVRTSSSIRSELSFGLSKPDGTLITEREWEAFVEQEITPRFPAGLTILNAHGQWWDGSAVVREESRIVIIIRPNTCPERENERTKIEEIRALYKSRFTQQAIMLVESPAEAHF